MGYRVGNAYDAAAEEERRAAWAALPHRRRILLRLRQAAIMTLIIAVLALSLAQLAGLF